MLRVAHVVKNLKIGGVGRVVTTLTGQMSDLGVETHILMLKRHNEYNVDPRVELHHVPIFGLSHQSRISNAMRRAGSRLLGKSGYWEWVSYWFCRQLQRRIKPYQFDCVYFHGLPVCWPLFRWQERNSLFVAHNLKSAQLRDPAEGFSDRDRARYPDSLRAKRLIAVSETVRQDLIQAFHIDQSLITTIHNPFDLDGIANQSEEPRSLPHGIADHGYLLYVGRLHAQKRVDLLFEAYQYAGPPEHLVLLGRGDERDRLEALAERLGIARKVHFLGMVSNPYPWMRSARALILPSAYEGFGNVLVEAVACGTQVVSARTGPAEEILTGPLSRGLVQPNNVASLAAKLMDASRSELARPGRKAVRQFDKAAVAADYLKLAGI